MLHRTVVLAISLTLLTPLAGAQRRGDLGPPSTPQFPDNTSAIGLTGSVRTADNRPVRDARIEVVNVMSGKTVADTYTSQGGTFDISNIPNGSYEVRAVAGLNEAHERIDLRGGGGVVNLRFQPDDAGEAGGRHTVSVAQYKVPGKARDAYKKAQSAMTKQKMEEASKYVEEALAAYPEYSDALTLRGIIKLDVGHVEEACNEFDHAIKADAGNSLAYIALGAAYNTERKYDDALRTIDRGITLAPTSWQAHFEMGKAYLGKGDYAAAVRQLNKAEDLGPKEYPLIHLVKAHALLGMKSYSEAMAELQWYLEKAPAGRTSDSARLTLEKVRAFAATTPSK